jgi:hypothetical protein
MSSCYGSERRSRPASQDGGLDEQRSMVAVFCFYVRAVEAKGCFALRPGAVNGRLFLAMPFRVQGFMSLRAGAKRSCHDRSCPYTQSRGYLR